MATPTLTTSLVTISDCESTTGWSGDTFVAETGIKKEGTQSLTCQMTVSGANAATFTPVASINLSGQHIRCWYQSGLIAYVDTVANAGVEFWISDGVYTHRWTIGGSDDWKSGWVNMVLEAESTPTSGYNASFDFTNVTSMGFVFNTTSKPRGVDNFWVDYLRYGNGITATGGTAFTAGNYISLDDIAAVDEANGYGIVEKSAVNGAITIFGSVNIGDGATQTYYKEDKSVAIFADALVSSTLYKLIGQGSGCRIYLDGFTLQAYNQTYTFDMTDADLNALTILGSAISNADAVYFRTNQSITTTVFDSCGQVDPSTAIFTHNTISNYVGTTGALLFPIADTNISDLTFLNCDNAVEYNPSSDHTTPRFINFTFDDEAGNYDVNNTAARTESISNIGSNANSYNPAGDIVIFTVAPVTTQITVHDIETGLPIVGARVLVEVADGVNFPYQESISIIGSSTTALVTHTGHGLASGDNVVIRGAVEEVFNGVYTINVTGENTYMYNTSETITSSPATGPIVSTVALIHAVTSVLGIASDTRSLANNQPIIGTVRMSTNSPFYKAQPISDTVDSTNGRSITLQLILDE